MKKLLTDMWIEMIGELQEFVKYLEDAEDVLQNAFEFLWKTVPDDWTPRPGQTAREGLRKVILAAVWYARLHEHDRLRKLESRCVELDDHPEMRTSGEPQYHKGPARPGRYQIPATCDPFKEMEEIAADVEDEERRQHLLALVQLGLANQDERFQKVYQMIYFEGKSWKETAKAMGVPTTYIQSLLKVGRNRLRAWLRDNTVGQPCSDSKSDD